METAGTASANRAIPEPVWGVARKITNAYQSEFREVAHARVPCVSRTTQHLLDEDSTEAVSDEDYRPVDEAVADQRVDQVPRPLRTESSRFFEKNSTRNTSAG